LKIAVVIEISIHEGWVRRGDETASCDDIAQLTVLVADKNENIADFGSQFNLVRTGRKKEREMW